jgi:hypothetical protein
MKKRRKGKLMESKHYRDTSPLDRQIEAEGSLQEWESSGYDCLMCRNPMGNWCGYVSVGREHPWHGLKPDDHATPLPERDTPEGIAFPIVSAFLAAVGHGEPPPEGMGRMDLCIAVHGGLTFSGFRARLLGQPDTDKRWTFGFDCAHAGDLVPELHRSLPAGVMLDDVYRDRDYVFGEVSRLAAQLRLVERRGYR